MLKPFVWGEADCCLSVCNILCDGGRGDPAEPFRGLYHDETGARALMQGTTEAVVARRCAELGWPEVDPAEARDWDVGTDGLSLAIRWAGRWAMKSDDGCLLRSRVRRGFRAWRPV